MAKVNTHVWVSKDGYPVLLAPGDTVPDGVTVTNPAVLDESEADETEGNVKDDRREEESEDSADGDESEDESPAEDAKPAPRKRASRKAPASE